MLYLEDYLEMIEHLPSELRDRFTEMREMDLSVQNRVDKLEDKQKTFFSSYKRIKPTEREEELERIRSEFKKAVDEASEKIGMADDCYSLVDRYLRKLDQELHKFKLELEADNRGITEILEKRSLEMDNPKSPAIFNPTNSSSHKENRLPLKKLQSQSRKNLTISHPSSTLSSPTSTHGSTIDRSKFIFDSLSNQSSDASSSSCPTPPSTFKGLVSLTSGPSQVLSPGIGRKISSNIKVSYEAMNLGSSSSIDGSASTSYSNSYKSPSETVSTPPPAKKQKIAKRSTSISDSSAQVLDVVSGGGSTLEEQLLGSLREANSSPSANELVGVSTNEPDWTYDPSEPRYCICNQVSYGDMVACDNQDCPYEWFHYPCVSISSPPKGKWYCPTCLANMARRKGRK